MLVKNATQQLSGERELCELVPDFDWFELSGALKVEMEFGAPCEDVPLAAFDVDVVVAYKKQLAVEFRLVGVRRLVLPKMVWPGGLDLGELEVVDVHDRQMEGIAYVLQDVGGGGFRCECLDVVFVSLSRCSEGKLVGIWRNDTVR